MLLLGKVCALALVVLVCSRLLRGSVPALSLPLAAAAAAAILSLIAADTVSTLKQLWQMAEEAGVSSQLVEPVGKVVVLAILTRFTSALCKDGGESAIASAVELAGTALSIYVVLPLLELVMQLLKELLT